MVKTALYASNNSMKINEKKTKLIVFNPCTSLDFMPEFQLGSNQLEVVDEVKLLGVTLRSDMSWKSNTETMVLKEFKKLWMVKILKGMGLLNKF